MHIAILLVLSPSAEGAVLDQPAIKKRELVATLAVLLVITLIVTAVTVTNKKKSPAAAITPSGALTAQTTTETTDSQTTTTNTAASTTNYKDGTYTATSTYESPGGEDSITISVTLNSGVISATSAQSGSTSRESEEYEDRFIASYKSLVVGKNIASLSLDRVSGASLTTEGFNDAIQQIKSQAQA